MGSLHFHRRHVDHVGGLVSYYSLIREILLEVILGKETLPISSVFKVKIYETWIIELLNISPDIILAYDTPYISKLTNSIIRVLLYAFTSTEATH